MERDILWVDDQGSSLLLVVVCEVGLGKVAKGAFASFDLFSLAVDSLVGAACFLCVAEVVGHGAGRGEEKQVLSVSWRV